MSEYQTKIAVPTFKRVVILDEIMDQEDEEIDGERKSYTFHGETTNEKKQAAEIANILQGAARP